MPVVHLQTRVIALLRIVYHQFINGDVTIGCSYVLLFSGICLQIYIYSSSLSANMVTYCISGSLILLCLWLLCHTFSHSKRGKLSTFFTSLTSLSRMLWLMWLGFLTHIISMRSSVSGTVMPAVSTNGASSVLSNSADNVPSNLAMPQLSDYNNFKDLMHFTLLSSVIIRTVVLLVRYFRPQPQLRLHQRAKSDEFYLWAGGLLFGCVAFLWSPWHSKNNWITLILIQTALWFNMAAISKRLFFGALSLITFLVFVTLFLLPRLRMEKLDPIVVGQPTPLAMVAYLCHLIIPAFFTNLSHVKMDKRWQSWFQRSHLQRILFVLLWFTVEIFMCVMCALTISRHQEWFIMYPIFAAVAFVWFSFHVVACMTLFTLQRKISMCTEALAKRGEANGGLLQIMASLGIRHFGLLSTRTLCLTIVSTVLLAMVSWETMTLFNMSLLLLLLPVECLIYCLFLDLSQSLGGTCIGYIIATPTLLKNPQNGNVTLLPPQMIQESIRSCTQSLASVHQFFSDHLIYNYGCDYSSSGFTQEFILNKLRLLFKQVTSDGPRYDTYLIYYTGETFQDGDWALGDGYSLNLDQLLKLWLEHVPSFPEPSSRLLLICDSANSHAWLSPIRRLATGCVALQTGIRDTSSKRKTSSTRKDVTGVDMESLECSNNFTNDWVTWNLTSNLVQRHKPAETERSRSLLPRFRTESSSSQEESNGSLIKSKHSQIDWSSAQRQIRAAYAVSQQWSNFTFHYPTSMDLERHWNDNFPAICLYLLRLVNWGLNEDTSTSSFGELSSTCACIWCEPISRWLRHLRMQWLPPLELDTGHGFYLVRSPNT